MTTDSNPPAFVNEEEEFLNDKKLIILDEALNCYEKSDTDRVRYSELKRLCNSRLAKLTNGRQTDFGGSFDKFIENLESKEEPTKRLLSRDKVSPKKTFIILDVPKVVNLLRKKGLIGSTDDDSFLKSLGPLKSSDILSTAKVVKIDDKTGLVHIESKNEDFEVLGDKDNRTVVKMNNSAALISNTWTIYTSSSKNENFRLDEKSIQQLLLLGKEIASKEKTMPFKIILEYGGLHSVRESPKNVEEMN